MLNVAVLGSGFMGETHARAFAKLSDVNIVGVSSRTESKAAELAGEVGAEPFTDAIELATHPDVEAVSVTLPTHLHEKYTVAALEAGKHVFVEKPMALTVDACDNMIAAAEANDRLLMVAHVLRFWPEYMALVEFVKSGQLGKPLSATASRLSTRPDWGDWFANPEWTGGAVHDMQIHDMDALNWLFGTPETVYARGQQGDAGGWDHVLTLVDYGDVKGFAEGSVMMPEGYPFTMTLWVLCENGSVEFTFRAGGTGVETGTTGGTNLVVYEDGEDPRALSCGDDDAYEQEIAYFVECVQGDTTPEQGTAEQGRLAVKSSLAARKSLDTDTVVTIDD